MTHVFLPGRCRRWRTHATPSAKPSPRAPQSRSHSGYSCAATRAKAARCVATAPLHVSVARLLERQCRKGDIQFTLCPDCNRITSRRRCRETASFDFPDWVDRSSLWECTISAQNIEQRCPTHGRGIPALCKLRTC